MFYGEIDMQDSFCGGEQYRQALKDLVDADQKLRGMLSDEQIVLLDQAKQRNNILGEISGCELFAEGFKFGAKLMLEIIYGNEE